MEMTREALRGFERNLEKIVDHRALGMVVSRPNYGNYTTLSTYGNIYISISNSEWHHKIEQVLVVSISLFMLVLVHMSQR